MLLDFNELSLILTDLDDLDVDAALSASLLHCNVDDHAKLRRLDCITRSTV